MRWAQSSIPGLSKEKSTCGNLPNHYNSMVDQTCHNPRDTNLSSFQSTWLDPSMRPLLLESEKGKQ